MTHVLTASGQAHAHVYRRDFARAETRILALSWQFLRNAGRDVDSGQICLSLAESRGRCDCGKGVTRMVHVESASRQPLVSLALERGGGDRLLLCQSRRNRTLSPSPDTCWRLTAHLGNLARWSHSGEPDRV